MTPIPRVGATIATLLLALLAVAAPAAAATRTAGGNDATGEATAGYDIDRADVTLDDQAGAVTVAITLAGTVAPDAYVQANFSDVNGSDCPVDAQAAVGGASAGGATEWQAADGTTGTGNPVSVEGNTIRFSATVPAAAPRTCVRFVSGVNNTSTIHDVTGFLTLDVPAPQPTPSPTPAPTASPTPAPTPAPKGKLRMSLSGFPKTLKPGRAARPTLTIRNAGNATAKSVKVGFRRGKGLGVKPGSISIKSLAAGRSVKVRLRLTLSRKASASTALRFTATGAGGLKRTLGATVRKPTKGKPKPRPKPTTGGLADTFWWWNVTTGYPGWNLYALRFYDNGYAYYRLPDDGEETAPAKCTSVTAKPDEDGDYGSGCVRWSLKGSRLTISDPSVVGTYRGGKLTLAVKGEDDPIEADELVRAKPGSRVNVSYLHRDAEGICAPGLYCSTSTDRLTLQADGQFGKSEEFLSTSGGVGTPFVAVAGYPPDKRGTYTILSGYRIRLSYADGTTKTFPFALLDKDAPRYADVPGLILGQYNYYFEPEDD